MQSTYEKGCDEVTDESGAIDICAHCASEDKLQPGLYYCFRCGSFGRYMCGDCNKQHRKYAHGHEVKSISDAAQQKEQIIGSYERGCDASQDYSGATDICAHCASDRNIQPAVYFCFQCGPFGRFMCENCNKYHKKFANAHEVRRLLKEALQTREKPKLPPRPRQRPARAEQTKAKADIAQFMTKSGEAGEKIRDSGWTDTADDSQATTTSTTEKVRSSYNGKELNTLPVLQRDQGNSSNEHRKTSNMQEIRKLDSNVEKVEQQVAEMQIHAAEKNRHWKPRQRPARAEQTKAKADIAQFMTKSGEAGEKIRDSGWTDTADDSQATTTSTTEKVRSSYNGKELNTLPVLQRDQGNSSNEHRKTSNMQEIRKLDSNVEKVEQQVAEMQIHAAEKNRHWKKNFRPSGDYLMVVAIEIDTNYTNYAFSGVGEFRSDPLKISTTNWRGNRGVLSTSSSWCVLFDKYRKFHSLGYEAEDNYSTFAENGEHTDYYFFRGIKMGKLELKRDLMLEDKMGKTIHAMDVFSECIKFLRKHCLENLRQKCYINDGDIRWVLVVPGIFNDASELFLREAAEKAEINCKNLRLVLKPEAASMYCQNLPVYSWNGLGPFEPHSKYLICDAGEFDINITAHEVMEDGYLKAFYKTSCNNCGDYFIRKAFRDFLASVVGNDVMDEFQATQIMDYTEMFHNLEVKMRHFKKKATKKISLNLPNVLMLAFKESRGKSHQHHIQTISQCRDKLRIDSGLFYGLFTETVDVAAWFLQSLFNMPQIECVSTILMVGKFSEFAMLQDVIMKTLPNKRFIIPKEPSLAVLRGAVIFGHSIE